MNVKPILFSTPMIRALLAGRKTKTRRVLQIPPRGRERREYIRPDMGGWIIGTDGGGGVYLDLGMTMPAPEQPCVWNQTTGTTVVPDYAVGDLLYVREAWQSDIAYADTKPSLIPNGERIFFRAGGGINTSDLSVCSAGWRPGIFLPRWASRLTLRITDVRIQRVQEISEADAMAEGIERIDYAGVNPACAGVYGWRDYSNHPHAAAPYRADLPVLSYRSLWDSLNAKRGHGWETNPFVAVYSFEVIDGNVDHMLERRSA